MNLPTEDEIIDFNLTLLNANKFEIIDLKKIIEKFNLDKNSNSIIYNSANRAERKGLIEFRKNSVNSIKLTPFGEVVLENGGWLKYLEHMENKELENNTKNVSYNITESIIGQLNHESNFSNSPITNNTTQNPKSELKINSPILKFWKLISENKLISSFILALILFAIKKRFNIEL